MIGILSKTSGNRSFVARGFEKRWTMDSKVDFE